MVGLVTDPGQDVIIDHIHATVLKEVVDFREILLPLKCEAIASFAVRDKSRLDVPRCRGGGSK